MIRTCGLLLVIGCMALPFGISGTLAQEPDTFPPDIITDIQANMDRMTGRENPPGMVVWVDAPGLNYEGASGYANLSDQTPMTPDRAFKIGSITKLFTAAVILQLVEEGALRLDDPLSLWLPEMAQGLPNGDKMIIRQLLNHTSGLNNFSIHPDLFPDMIAALTIDPVNRTATGECRNTPMNEILARYAFDQPALFDPGESGEWAYTNTGYNLLGMVIEAATGSSLADAYQTRIFAPLEMTSTYLECYQEPTGDLVGGYTTYLNEMFEASHIHDGYMAWSSGGIVSTAADLTMFARALFTGQLFDDRATLELMVTPLPEFDYGLGVMVQDDQWGHRGSITGFASWLGYDPARDAVVIVLMNGENDPTVMTWTVSRYMRDVLAAE